MMNIRQQRGNLDHVAGTEYLEQVALPFSAETYKPGDARKDNVYGAFRLIFLVYDRAFGKLANLILRTTLPICVTEGPRALPVFADL